MKNCKPEYAGNFPKKIYVKTENGDAVLRSVRWGSFLPDWIESSDKSFLVPYVVVDNNPFIICTENGNISYLCTLSDYLQRYDVQLLSCGGHKEKNWWLHIG